MATILITGGNSGIGYYMVERLLQQHHTLIVLDLKTDNLKTLSRTYCGNLLTYRCHIGHMTEVEKVVEDVLQQVPAVDIVVHNACGCPFLSAYETKRETYRQVFNVNYGGALRLYKSLLPTMLRKGKGRFIFAGSGVGTTGFQNLSAYASSKAALEAFAKCLNLEHQHQGISFQMFQPPLTNTASACALPVPHEMKADPKKVGYGLADHIH